MKIADYKIAVLGGGGFLGSHIVNELKKKTRSPIVPRTNQGYDFRDFNNVLGFFNKHKPEVVFNCAAHQGGIQYQHLYAGRVLFDNLIMGAHIMEAARMCGSVVKYINIIAGCSYPGYIEDGILSEDRYWEGPMHETVENYGITKRAQVLQGKYYKKQYGFNSIPLILINLYGPGEHFHPDRSHGLAALLRKFYEAKKYEQPEVVIWGSGKPIREWLYVEDAAQGVIRAADIYEDTEPLNIAVGKGYTITELANIIKDIVGYRGKLVYDKTKPDGALKKVADISKMKRILHWEPQASIEDGIKKLYQWLDSNYEEVIGLN